MTTIVLAPDSFKECISATDACAAMCHGILSVAECDPVSIPMADGGEGTGTLLADCLNLNRVTVDAVDPMRRPITANYYLSKDNQLAIVECADANGLGLLKPSERNPEAVDTFGCGLLVAKALEAATEQVLITVGGSVTVDGGKGMAEALGYRFLDDRDQDLPPGAESLRRLARIVPADSPFVSPTAVTLCDVTNPLLGPNGAAPVFAPQKGADPAMVERLEEGLERLASRIHHDLGIDVATVAGGGAAGGLGAGSLAFVGAELTSGAEEVADVLGLDAALREADLVITGEGRVDDQSFGGKVLSAVLTLAESRNTPVAIIAGEVACSQSTLDAHNVHSCRQLMQPGETRDDSMSKVKQRLAEAAASIVMGLQT